MAGFYPQTHFLTMARHSGRADVHLPVSATLARVFSRAARQHGLVMASAHRAG